MSNARELAELGGSYGTGGFVGMKNRIINGQMMIDQRNAGASVTPTTGVYTLDRWALNVSAASKVSVQRNAGSVTPPAGFSNYAGLTSTSAYTVLAGDYISFSQAIEGFNVADLNWGTASAATVTLSFWVRSSQTGTFGGVVQNDGLTRSYPFTFVINAANTWEQKAITIAGDTSGTWLTNNGAGIRLLFGIGVGSTYQGTAGSWASANFVSATGATNIVATNGATFYITGVQLEKGSTATAYDYRPYGTELALCQRYYRRYSSTSAGYTAIGVGLTSSATAVNRWGFTLDTPMRAKPTPAFNSCVVWNSAVGGAAVASSNYSSVNYIDMDINTSGLVATAGLAAKVLMSGTSAYIELTGAEL